MRAAHEIPFPSIQEWPFYEGNPLGADLKMAAGVDKKGKVFLCYSYLSQSDSGLNEDGNVPSARVRTPLCVYDFVRLLVENGIPRNSIHTADEPIPAGSDTDWHSWYEGAIKESLVTLCFITPHFSKVVQKGIDECRQIPSTNVHSITNTTSTTTCTGTGGEVADLTSHPLHDPLEPNMPHLPGHIVRRLVEDPQLTFIPLFLGQSRDVSLIPLVLQGRRNYAVQYPFVSARIGDSSDLELQDLIEDVFDPFLAVSNTINSSEPPANCIDIGVTSGNLFRDYRSFLSFGSKREIILKQVSSHVRLPWDALAERLGVSQSDMEAIKYNHPLDAREQAYQMLLKWTDDHAAVATVARFAVAVTSPAKVNQRHLLDELNGALQRQQL